MVRIGRNEMVVKVRFDRPIDHSQTSLMAMIMAGVMVFREVTIGRRSSFGWRIGKAKVVKVEQLLPGDLADIENAEMLALRLEGAGYPLHAGKARVGMSRAALLTSALEEVEPSPEMIEIISGTPGVS